MTSTDRQRGSATVELAVALPALAALIALVAALAVLGGGAVSCHQAAGAAARTAALGQGPGVASAVAQEVAGPGTRATLTPQGAWIEVTLRCPVRLPWGEVGVTAGATVLAEPGG